MKIAQTLSIALFALLLVSTASSLLEISTTTSKSNFRGTLSGSDRLQMNAVWNVTLPNQRYMWRTRFSSNSGNAVSVDWSGAAYPNPGTGDVPQVTVPGVDGSEEFLTISSTPTLFVTLNNTLPLNAEIDVEVSIDLVETIDLPNPDEPLPVPYPDTSFSPSMMPQQQMFFQDLTMPASSAGTVLVVETFSSNPVEMFLGVDRTIPTELKYNAWSLDSSKFIGTGVYRKTCVYDFNDSPVQNPQNMTLLLINSNIVQEISFRPYLTKFSRVSFGTETFGVVGAVAIPQGQYYYLEATPSDDQLVLEFDMMTQASVVTVTFDTADSGFPTTLSAPMSMASDTLYVAAVSKGTRYRIAIYNEANTVFSANVRLGTQPSSLASSSDSELTPGEIVAYVFLSMALVGCCVLNVILFVLLVVAFILAGGALTGVGASVTKMTGAVSAAKTRIGSRGTAFDQFGDDPGDTDIQSAYRSGSYRSAMLEDDDLDLDDTEME